ncbi:MAG: tetratricopeptide repeat protein [Phycisphaeraceae bacterium]|nr:tetratricopeptide repeat protein [Phycisphaeraceae bacterium]
MTKQLEIHLETHLENSNVCLFPSRLMGWLIIILLGAVAYQSSYTVPFIFDDIHAIVENPHVRQWDSLSMAMGSPTQSSLSGRPVVSLSFALQGRGEGALSSGSFHLFNHVVHLFNALLVFEILCLILRFCHQLKLRFWAFAAACIWTVLPLNSEAVVYLTQRTELLVSLFYLLTLYGSLRYLLLPREFARGGWLLLAVISSALGMGCKENMVSVPVMVLLLDRTLVSGTFGKSIKSHRGLYVGLVATWFVLLLLNINTPRSASAGLGLSLSSWDYLLTQSNVIGLYLWQLFTGLRLSITHDMPILHHVGQTLPVSLVPLLLAGLTVYGLIKKHPLALAGALFFMVLAPSSSLIPIVTEVVAERRMYLPSAGVLAVLLGLGGWLQSYYSQRGCRALMLAVIACLTLLCLWGTHQRLKDYQQEKMLWASALHLYPDDVKALNGLGYAHIQNQAYDLAMPLLLRAVAIKPSHAEAYDNLGLCYLSRDDLDQGRDAFERAIAANPNLAKPYNNLGIVLARQQQFEAATGAFLQALDRSPSLPAAHLNLGVLLNNKNQFAQAFDHLSRSLPMLSGDERLTCLMQMVKSQLGQNQPAKAVRLLRQVLTLKPDHPQAGALLKRLESDF